MKNVDPLYFHNPPLFELVIPIQYKNLPPPDEEELAKLEEYEKEFCARRVHELHNAAAIGFALLMAHVLHPEIANNETEIIAKCPNPGSYANQDMLLCMTEPTDALQVVVHIHWNYELGVFDLVFKTGETYTAVVADLYQLMLNYQHVNKDIVRNFLTYAYTRAIPTFFGSPVPADVELYNSCIDTYTDLEQYDSITAKRKYKPKNRGRSLCHAVYGQDVDDKDMEPCGKRKRV
jgi:hypothetical protein